MPACDAVRGPVPSLVATARPAGHFFVISGPDLARGLAAVREPDVEVSVRAHDLGLPAEAEL